MARKSRSLRSLRQSTRGWRSTNTARFCFFTGKVELGTGIETALSQLVAEELGVAVGDVRLVMGDTDRCPDQFPTVGSMTIARAGPQLRQAAAEARHALLAMGSAQLGTPAATLNVDRGRVIAPDGRELSYGQLIGGKRFERNFSGNAITTAAPAFGLIGKSVERVDIPAKVYGTHPYVHNLRVPNMLHGVVLRPPVHGAPPIDIDARALKKMPGKPQLVNRGNFVGVVAADERLATEAAAAVKIQWGAAAPLPGHDEIPDLLRRSKAHDKTLVVRGSVDAAAAGRSAVYHAPYQLHASIGPSCAVADVRPDRATLWSATQSSFPLRDSIAALLPMAPEQVHLIWMEGSGCYGHNGADDCTADAALLSQAMGKPVRVQYSRQNENLWEPKGLAMRMEVRGTLDGDGAIRTWDYEVWSPNHISARPFAAGNLLAGIENGHAGVELQAGADRNAKHAYKIPNYRAVLHLLPQNPLRCSSFRGLGSPQNSFANESFVDELANAADVDPITFRLNHLDDPRARATLEEVARISNWEKRGSGQNIGHGVAFVQYANYSAYVAMVIKVYVAPDSGKVRTQRVWVAHDCGLIVNPDGVRNQIEGNVIQTLSRGLYEELHFDRSGIDAADWTRYPILRFSDVPDDIAISLINRPDQDALGAGEPAASPVFAALANAIFDATGKRLRRIPFTPTRVKTAMMGHPEAGG